MKVSCGDHLPVLTSAGPSFANVSGKSMITKLSGLPETISIGLGVVGRLFGVIDDLLADGRAAVFQLLRQRVGEPGAVEVVAGTDVDRLSFEAAEHLFHPIGERDALEPVGRRYGEEPFVVEVGEGVASTPARSASRHPGS